jgi:hypothetical protein
VSDVSSTSLIPQPTGACPICMTPEGGHTSLHLIVQTRPWGPAIQPIWINQKGAKRDHFQAIRELLRPCCRSNPSWRRGLPLVSLFLINTQGIDPQRLTRQILCCPFQGSVQIVLNLERTTIQEDIILCVRQSPFMRYTTIDRVR